MPKIVKSYSNKSQFEIDHGVNVSSFVSFERLKPYLGVAVGLKKNEEISGIVVHDMGIDVKIENKND